MAKEKARKPKEDYEPYVNTTGNKKLLAYYQEIIRTELFQKRIRIIRESFSIPPNGFPHKLGESLYMPPQTWEHRDDFRKEHELDKEIDRMCMFYDLPSAEWRAPISLYIFYNDSVPMVGQNAFNLCIIKNISNHSNDPFSKGLGSHMRWSYPISIGISPYASLRDILDYIKRTYTAEIKPLQEEYRNARVKIGKVRPKKASVQELNDYIFTHRDLPHKEIARLVFDVFGKYLAYSEVAKIISNERKKREK